eukprot:TRINITY_DN22705_c0_g1_i1.p1 TRINITY_DN22705_c0_g1~~TRINITY_DN22705_c0_g1_i1.p1  ORF type:complete len:181 (+),score=36.01 TRINITY_DN22705_c0_g1_i1:86-628(+)
MAFANTVLKHYPRPEKALLGLVPCAIGGTAIREWEKGSKLYNMMISRTKSALNDGALRALLWYQGESDALSAATAENYKQNMKRFIDDVRSDLKQPDLLFIQVAINVEDETPTELVQKVREAQLSINITNVFTVDAKGLPLKPDKLHLTTEAQAQLGIMLGNEYIKHSNLQQHNIIVCDG